VEALLIRAWSRIEGVPSWGLLLFALAGMFAAYAVAATPLVPLAFAWLALLFCRQLSPGTTAALLLSIVFAMATTYASRRFGMSPFDDFSNVYYPSYLNAKVTSLAESILPPFEAFGLSALEVVFPAILGVLGLLPGTLTPSAMIFLITAGIGSLYVWWLSRFFLPTLPRSHQAASALLCIIFFSFGLCSQTVRQMLSIPLLLAAIWERNLGRSATYAVIASACHLSAAPIWAVCALFRFTGYRMLMLASMPLVILLVQGPGLAESLIGLDPGTLDKLSYYTAGNQDAAGFDRNFIPLVLLVVIGSLAAVGYRNGELSRILLFFCLLFFALLPLPLASFRATLFITSSLLAPLACLALSRRIAASTFAVLCAALSAAMIAKRVLLTDDTSEMGLWHLFEPVEVFPFQYVIRIVSGA
jgi:hypothetical protein